MKYKLLLTGENNVVIDDLFLMMHKKYDMMTTSIRSQDVVKHLALFEPDVFIYCIQMSQVLDLDILEVASKKMDKNALKYPVEKAKSSSTKYDKL